MLQSISNSKRVLDNCCVTNGIKKKFKKCKKKTFLNKWKSKNEKGPSVLLTISLAAKFV